MTSEPLVRLADVAESIVSGYLARVAALLNELELQLPSRAYFRVTPGTGSIALHIDGPIVIEPAFEVLVLFDQTSPGIGRVLSNVAVTTPGRVHIVAKAELDGSVVEEDLSSGSWSKALVPDLDPVR